MRTLYLLPSAALIALPVILALAVILQTRCIVYGFFRFRYRSCNLWETFQETAILFQLLFLTVLTAEAVNQIHAGFVVVRSYSTARILLYLVILALSLGLALSRKSPRFLLVPAIAFLTLPISEQLLDRAFPAVLFTAIALWIIRSIRHLYADFLEKQNRLSAFSIKEAVDTMDFGLLFCRSSGSADGQILLANRKMQELMFTLTGSLMYNGKDFYQRLVQNQVISGCQKCGSQPQLLYQLPDGSVWEFDLQYVPGKKEICALLTASDATRNWEVTEQLYRQNKELEQRNRQLKEMLRNMESICRSEETLHIKGLVHDLLGQKITILLRSVREHQELDKAMLETFVHGLPEALQEVPADFSYSLQLLIEDFRGLGVTIHTDGRFPENRTLRKAFFEICSEAMSNAVRHGYANEITIKTNREAGRWLLHISDNGLPVEGAVIEGGGLRGMRRRACELGGTFQYTAQPHFSISVTIPEDIVS